MPELTDAEREAARTALKNAVELYSRNRIELPDEVVDTARRFYAFLINPANATAEKST